MTDFVSPGQPFRPKAATWNQIIESSQAYARQQRLGDAAALPPGYVSPFTINIKNSSGGAMAAGDVLTVGDLLVDEVRKREAWFDGDTYATGDLNVAILLEDIPNNGIGRAQIGGLVKATVDIQNTAHDCATPINGADVLDSCYNSPIKLVHAPNSTGEQDCWIWLEQLCFRPSIRFTLSSALTTATASITGTIVDQWGRGIDNTTTTSAITLNNLVDHTGSSYVFEGDSGDVGIADHDRGTIYRIKNLECP